MRILVIHNAYRSSRPSGENDVVRFEVDALRQAGYDVGLFEASSDPLAALAGTPQTVARGVETGVRLYNEAGRRLASYMSGWRPDVVHVHNPYPLIGLRRILSAAVGKPVVQTIHNYRYRCVAGTLFRSGAVCTECSTAGHRGPGLLHACYQGSRSRTLAMVGLQRADEKVQKDIRRFFVQTDFMRDTLIGWGFDPEKLVVKPNGSEDPGPYEPPRSPTTIVYAGRLSAEKGVSLLVAAWRQMPLGHGTLKVLGAGPLEHEVRELATARSDVSYVGEVSGAAVGAAIRDCGSVVIPSLCFEGFPRVAAAAFSYGRPVVSTVIGGLRNIVRPELGYRVEPEAASLASAMGSLLADGSGRELRGRRAREVFLERYARAAIVTQLETVYQDVLTDKRRLA